MRQLALAIFVISATFIAAAPSHAQQSSDGKSVERHFTDGIIGQFDSTAGDLALEPATINARIAPATTDRPPVLLITAKIAPDRHTYSLTQPKGGPRPTKIEIDPSSDFRLLAPLRANPEPKSHIEQGQVWTGLKIEEHEGEVTWYAPIEITAGVDPAKLEIRGTINMEVCQTGGYCEPVEQKFVAKPAPIKDLAFPLANWGELPAIPAQSPVGKFQSKGSSAQLSGQISPAAVMPGESVDLQITATLPASGRIYAHADRDIAKGTKPVLIAIQSATGLVPHRPTTDAPIKTDASVEQFGTMKYHQGTVTWTTRFDVPKSATPGEYKITGLFAYQVCEYGGDGQNVCELPQSVQFAGEVVVGNETAATGAPLTFAPGPGYSKAAETAAVFADFFDRQSPGRDTTPVKPTPAEIAAKMPVIGAADAYDLSKIVIKDSDEGSIAYYIAIAFVGGLILNLMPCVLPVLGLKVMSFVEQSGQSRAHALVLNVWYSAGIIAVFLLLGVLAISIGLTWGGQFGSTAFNATMAAVVFAMSLSLLGVWVVPIPGFFGSGTAHEAAEQEGPLGAFLKGVITTVLATPCTAPIMAAATAWAVRQPAPTTLAVFATLGIGMSSPYIVTGFYPELLRFLPKPGAWMETFKQIMGFVLLATIVFILSYMEPAAVVPTVALLMGIGVACWLIGRTPLTAELKDRLQTWGLAGAILLAFAVASFGWLYRDVMQPRFAASETVAHAATDGPWQPFSLERLKQVAVDEGRTVLVDFSADWCFNCKVLEQAVLHTEPVEKAIAESGAVTMYADYTDYPEELTNTIKALKANGVPVIAVFPADKPYEPIVFGGGYTAGGLVEALSKASGRQLKAGSSSIAEAGAASTPRN